MLENSLPIFCNGICSTYGVIFEMQGQKAFTDYNKVVIPQIDITNPRAITLGLGYTVHECGHISSTNPHSKRVFFGDSGEVILPIPLSFYRVIEDVRMERAQWSRLQGSKRILNNLVTTLTEQGVFEEFNSEDEPATVLQKFVLYYSRGFEAHQVALSQMLNRNEELISEKIPSGILVKLKALLSTISSLKNTDDSVALALRLSDTIKSELENNTDPNDSKPNGSESKRSESSDSGPENTLSNGSGSSNSQSSELTPGSKNQQTNSSGINDGSNQDTSESNKSANLLASLSNMTSNDVIKSDVGELTEIALNSVSKRDCNKIVPISKLDSYPGSPDSQIAKEANALSNVLKIRLLNYLEELSDISFNHTEDGDEVDDTRLADIVLGETEVFLERTKSDFTYDTSVHILLDRSGSMQSIMQKACVATLGLALTLNQVDGISCSATAFPSGEHDVLLLSDGEDVRRQTQRFNLSTNGSTPMASAMWQALQMLYSSQHKRLMLIVITDGSPNSGQLEATKQLINSCIKSGVDLLGVGLGGNTKVGQLFPNSVEVDSVDKLTPALFSQLQKFLAVRAA